MLPVGAVLGCGEGGGVGLGADVWDRMGGEVAVDHRSLGVLFLPGTGEHGCHGS